MFSYGESDKKLAWTKRLGQQKQIRLLWWQIVKTVLCTTTRTPHPNTFLLYPPPACFTTEQSTVKASLVVKSSIKLNLDTVCLQIPWKNQGVDYEQSLFFSWSVEQKGARHAYHPARDWRRARFSRLAANQRSRRHALPSLNLKKKRDCSKSKQAVKGVTRKGFDFPTFPKLFTSTLSEAKERDHRGPSWASTDSRSWPDDISYISSFPAYKYIANKEKGIICPHSSSMQCS